MHTDVQNSPYEQAALTEFLRTRKFDRHIKKMRKLYAIRRATLLESLTEAFGHTWRVWGDAAGLHLVIQFPGMVFDDSFLTRCTEFGIRISTAEQHSIRKGVHLDKLLLGYGHLEPTEIQSGVFRLRSLILSE